MSEIKKKFITERLLANEVSSFELAFHEKMMGNEFMNDGLFKLLRFFSEINTENILPLILNSEYFFWIDEYENVRIHRSTDLEYFVVNEQYILVYKIGEGEFNSKEKRIVENLVRKIDKLNIKKVGKKNDSQIPVSVAAVYTQQISIGQKG